MASQEFIDLLDSMQKTMRPRTQVTLASETLTRGPTSAWRRRLECHPSRAA